MYSKGLMNHRSTALKQYNGGHYDKAVITSVGKHGCNLKSKKRRLHKSAKRCKTHGDFNMQKDMLQLYWLWTLGGKLLIKRMQEV